MPPRLLAHHTHYIMGYNNRIQNGPHDSRGLAKAMGSEAKPVCWVSAAYNKQSEGQSDTKGG
jgi:hypothetical protein